MSDEQEKSVRFADATYQAGFTQIPNAVLRDPNLSVAARFTYGLLASFAWEDESCYPGQKRLAADTGVSERSLRTYIEELEAKGLVTVTRRGLRQTNRYTLHTPSEAANVADQDRKPASDQERNSASDQDRKRASAEENSGCKKTHSKKAPYPHGKVNRKPVTDDEYTLASEIVAAWNEIAGTGLTVDAHLTPIIGRIREKPQLDAHHHRKIIERNFAGKPWWEQRNPGRKPGPRVIYGSAELFENAIETARAAGDKSKYARYDQAIGGTPEAA